MKRSNVVSVLALLAAAACGSSPPDGKTAPPAEGSADSVALEDDAAPNDDAGSVDAGPRDGARADSASTDGASTTDADTRYTQNGVLWSGMPQTPGR